MSFLKQLLLGQTSPRVLRTVVLGPEVVTGRVEAFPLTPGPACRTGLARPPGLLTLLSSCFCFVPC